MGTHFSWRFSSIVLTLGPFPYILGDIFHAKLDTKLYSFFANKPWASKKPKPTNKQKPQNKTKKTPKQQPSVFLANVTGSNTD